MEPPILMLIAGPNGSGKSTVTSELNIIGDYVNADEIESYLGCTSFEAAQIAEATREYMLSMKKSFTFESVLSTPRNYNLMERAKKMGYKVIVIYILTKDVEINIFRVESRVKKGGHDVPSEKVRERYYRAMKLFPNLFNVCDECYVYDNSLDRTQGKPEMIIKWQYGNLELIPNSIWSLEMLFKLYSGNYCKDCK